MVYYLMMMSIVTVIKIVKLETLRKVLAEPPMTYPAYSENI
jgi:hypothetical protein